MNQMEVFLPAPDQNQRPYICIQPRNAPSMWFCWGGYPERWVELTGPPIFPLRNVTGTKEEAEVLVGRKWNR